MKLNPAKFLPAILLILLTLFLNVIAEENEELAKVVKAKADLQKIVDDIVKKDKEYRNCMMTVAFGDASFKWSGAAGLADEKNQIQNTVDTPFYVASITKLFTATIVMQMSEEGELKLDDPIAEFLPMSLIKGIHIYKGVDYTDKIQIQHLISHTSGIPDYYEKAPKGEKSFFELLLEEPEREWTVEEVIAIARDKLKPEFDPGKKAQYSDTNFQLLGFIIEKVTSKPLHEVYREYIFQPLGMTQTYLFTRSEPIKPLAAKPAHIYYKNIDVTHYKGFEVQWADGGIVSTMHDCLLFLKALNSGKLIKEKTNLEMMHNWRKLMFPLKYGFGTMYFELPWYMAPFSSVPPVWGHSGSTGSFLYYCEDLDIYMVGSTNQAKSQSKPFQMMIKAMKIMKKLRKN